MPRFEGPSPSGYNSHMRGSSEARGTLMNTPSRALAVAPLVVALMACSSSPAKVHGAVPGSGADATTTPSHHVDASQPPPKPGTDAGEKEVGPGDAAASFRAVFITDTHIIGPQYVCCSESNWVDDDSIEKTVARLNAVRDEVNAITPAPSMVFVIGDVVHNADYSEDALWYREHVNAYTIAQQIFAGFHMPVYMAMGNHDYGSNCGSAAGVTRAFSEDRFKEFFNQDPYSAVDYGGWKFILGNSEAGDTFDPQSPNCNSDYGSVGATQMKWVEQQLKEGKPTVVMTHYMRILYEAQEEEGSPYPNFPALLDAYKGNIKAFLAGHTHRWLDMTSTNNGVFHWVLGGTRYDANNFWEIEFHPDGTFQVLDEGKAIQANSCSEPWTYNGTPKALPDPPIDAGDDCVQGLGN
jgi:predicted MPP superfamily phosphohydrolase